ncbi:MAG: carbamoyl-phosphate synthase large subunit [Planctomycetes bacterium]|nr:carbamoyl-phosphate synthase large subunit [Planctomycetota bacterium]
MPKRTDLKKILIIGSGPIVIGQACEFDYSGTQACKALKEEGYEVVLVNSNPATIMTDPEMADRTYIEPITWQVIEKIIEAERPDAILPTLGGQTGLNTALDLYHHGVLDRYGVEMIGARADVIEKAEKRELFKAAMIKIGLLVPASELARDMESARRIRDEVGLPCVIRPSLTLGGTGGSIAWNRAEFDDLASRGMHLSPIHEVLIDQTLTDKEYQLMRDAAIAIIREIGVETGGSNIQFAIHPDNGRMVVIEMNPRVSRSSALASKATGFPIAKIAAKLAIGYRLDELPNDIVTGKKGDRSILPERPFGFFAQNGPVPFFSGDTFVSACFEPTIDYVVTKVPRWAFEKFPEADPTLGVQMKSVGEAMAIGRTFKESLQKALRSLETGRFGLGCDPKDLWGTGRQPSIDQISAKLATPNAERVWYIRYAFKVGMSVEKIFELTHIDPWFLDNILQIVELEDDLRAMRGLGAASPELIRRAKQSGYSDKQLATIWNCSESEVRRVRVESGNEATFKMVDTCGAEFEARTPYYYSTYETEDETRPAKARRIMILGGGPNRIGQGIEFDYCCCQAAFALKKDGFETIMVNSNPETVSTDYDTSDVLFFEPLTVEDVLNICDRLKPDGIIVQFGGQTPLNLARALEAAGAPIIGTSPASIDMAEDRELFDKVLERLGLRRPPNGSATSLDQARLIAGRIGYPVLVRPSFVLGGRAMVIVYDEESLAGYVAEAVEVSPGRPVLIDKFLEDAIEVDVDAVSDGDRTIIGGIMQHVEEAGIHSGDSACAIPPQTLPQAVIRELKEATYALSRELRVCGLMNVQYAVKDGQVYVLEVNPRASRTVPFVSKATGVPLARIAARCMVGQMLAKSGLPAPCGEERPGVRGAGSTVEDTNPFSLDAQGITEEPWPQHVSVKESVFPFAKFPGVDIVLGPEMRSTGEVMGIDDDFPMAFAKSQLAASSSLPLDGTVFVSVAERDKRSIIPVARKLKEMGFRLVATSGTTRSLTDGGVEAETIRKLQEGRPNLLDLIRNDEIALVINTPSGKGARSDEGRIRAAATAQGVPCITTLAAARVAVQAIEALRTRPIRVSALQDRFAPADIATALRR